MAGVKIVVWDLDETLWAGTLDAGDTVVPGALLRLVGPLAATGVVSSVCSNNEPATAEAALRARGVWDLVVFPQISWRPKTEMIADLLELVGARPDDVLFVDDNARERGAVAATCGVRGVDPAELAGFDVATLPGTDAGLERLERYRLLERKSRARATGDAVSPAEFLRSSRIVVAEGEPGVDTERVAELSLRSNQLNFTGSRLTVADIRAMHRRPEVTSRALWVRDRFGDYGLAGFYALDRGRRVLEHFFFSCRLLNMGVEAWVFHQLGDPCIPGLAPERGRALHGLRPDWIEGAGQGTGAPPGPHESARSSSRTLWIGGCDLQVLAAYLGAERKRDRWEVLGERNGVQQYGHSSVLTFDVVRNGLTEHLDRVPWTANWSAAVFDPAFDTVVLSPWVDYASLTYEHRSTGIRIPSFVHLTAGSSEEDWRHWWGLRAGREQFLHEYLPRGPLAPNEIAERIAQLSAWLGAGRRLVLLNAPEVPRGHMYSDGGRQTDRHIAVNAAVDDAVRPLVNVSVLDVRETVQTDADLASPDDPMMFHYDRQVYRELAQRLSLLLA